MYIRALEVRVAALEATVQHLLARRRMDSRNSSQPPSSAHRDAQVQHTFLKCYQRIRYYGVQAIKTLPHSRISFRRR
jgi:hypothetical protein